MRFPFLRTLLMLSVLTSANADFGNWFVVDQRVAHRLDSADQILSFRFTCPEDITLTAASVFCVDAKTTPAYTLSIHADSGGTPSPEVLTRQDFVPSPSRWMTIPLASTPLEKGKVYHLVLKSDLLRGSDHTVGACDTGHYASFATTLPLNGIRPGDGSKDPMANSLFQEKGHWKTLGQEPVYALFGLGDRFQGDPYDEPGAQPIYGQGPSGDKTQGRWSGEALHFHCGFQAQALAIRVRKVGNPKTPLHYVILKHEFRIHRCVAMADGIALDPGKASDRYQWVTIGWQGLAAANFSPECWFLALHSDSGKISSSPEGCEDCYLLSEAGNSGGLARADDLGFDGGPHLSREIYNLLNGSPLLWQDAFERDANVGALGPLCPEVPGFQPRPIPTPLPLTRSEGLFP